MVSIHNHFFHLVLFFLLAGLASSTTISDNVFESSGLTGRNILQAKQDCPVNLENQNYTIITSQCKGPQYNATVCCDAFKQLACPYSEQISDMSNNCASTLFSYINLYGKYPPGLFSSLCREGKDGLDCEETLKAQAKNSIEKSTAPPKIIQSPMLLFTSAFMVLLLLKLLF